MTEALAPAPAFSVEAVTVAYQGRPALWDVTWSAGPGLNAIVGPNGAGKSTLLKAALGLVPAVAGTARFFGRPLAELRERVAYLPQRASVDWDFPASVLDVVAMARLNRMRWFGRLPRDERERAMAALAEVGLAELAERPIGALSGGQQQRVFLARALAQGADLYLMDEPFAAVDAATEVEIVGVLRRLAAAGRTIVAVHHDLSNVAEYFSHVLLLNGRVIASGPIRRAFTPENLAAAYGGRLVLLDQARPVAGASAA
jgi:manganese/zinc/iron transport system ATP- binding protein